jgi:hypothetical protein
VKVRHQTRYPVAALLLGVTVTIPALAAETLPDSKAIMKAMVDEMARSTAIQMEDLEKPYFIRYTVEDSIAYEIAANHGDITSSQRRRERKFYSRVRVGSYELDNTNFADDSGRFFMFFGGPGGAGRAELSLDEDYTAIRQAIWRATDADYKDAVETLTKKRAYLRDKSLQDRPNDFSKAEVVEHVEPTARISFDRSAWETKLKKISARFNKYPQIQESKAQLFTAAGNVYTVNTEGTRARTSELGALLFVTAGLQAEDGMKLSDSLSYCSERPEDLPEVDKILADIDELVGRLTKATKAPVLDSYTGPVLFEGIAAGQMFRTLLAEAIAGHVEPVGTQRRRPTGAGSLERKLGQRILPTSFRVHDDPTVGKVGDNHLLGHYTYDDEGVKAKRTVLVADGVLENLALSRVPTKKLSGSNGHGRRLPGQGTLKSAIGCLFIADQEGVSDDKLKAKLIEEAENAGLEYGLRIASLKTAGIASSPSDLFAMFARMQQRGGQENIGDPIYTYKVYVEDGREELVRGCEFGQVKVRDLKQILAGGNTPVAYNYIGLGFGGATPATSIVTPAVLFEELELSKIEQEHEKLPILETPLTR